MVGTRQVTPGSIASRSLPAPILTHSTLPVTRTSTTSSINTSPQIAGYPPELLRKRRAHTSTANGKPDSGFTQLQNPATTKQYRNFQSYPSHMSIQKAHYHPFLFALMTLSALAELGLTAFLIGAGNENGTWPSSRYHSMLIMFLFNAIWTTIFSAAYMIWMVDGGSHFMANVASSVIWLLVTTILWGVAAGIMHDARGGGNCDLRPIIHRCRQSLTVEALGWTEFGLCILTMVLTCLWIQSQSFHRRKTDLSEVVGSGESMRRLV